MTELREKIGQIIWETVWPGGTPWDKVVISRPLILERADQILALGLVQLAEDQTLPACPRFEWHDIDACETKCNFELMRQHCPLLQAGWRKVVKP